MRESEIADQDLADRHDERHLLARVCQSYETRLITEVARMATDGDLRVELYCFDGAIISFTDARPDRVTRVQAKISELVAARSKEWLGTVIHCEWTLLGAAAPAAVAAPAPAPAAVAAPAPTQAPAAAPAPVQEAPEPAAPPAPCAWCKREPALTAGVCSDLCGRYHRDWVAEGEPGEPEGAVPVAVPAAVTVTDMPLPVGRQMTLFAAAA